MSGIYSKKVLLVMSDQQMISPLLKTFSLADYETFQSHDVSAAIAETMRIHPDIVILDVKMAGVDGFEYLEALRANADPVIAKIPVIIASETGDLVEISRALKLGISDYFVKSRFDVSQVFSKVKKHLGDTSTVVPPVQDGNAEASVSAPTASDSLQQIKLLIVEDDKFLRDLATQKLIQENFAVHAAVDGEQGIALAEKELPQVVLLDILLPGIDGFEVLKRIRANPALKDTRVIMLSNFGQREDVEKALSSGADQFLVKANFTLDEIIEEAKNIMKKERKPL
ncbi:MAG: hypothetical protein A2494_03380 [Candidatus Lloydbacteria bacterium RIFOXYC12_FULL_46_25]|uniref:Response regulatory domain-containing protein n=1 Tax=Candidatus Lloydbacteria bacterium RIFOXYC12_FULL_46_25 TaxID=1798670 RepID=A0A1G2E303_9BACT|nr:MAG: hypothetical protein A2494_03380 [Candidatus Lloydbacteria bacterium RIFOXYC12_FULL_46_25]